MYFFLMSKNEKEWSINLSHELQNDIEIDSKKCSTKH